MKYSSVNFKIIICGIITLLIGINLSVIAQPGFKDSDPFKTEKEIQKSVNAESGFHASEQRIRPEQPVRPKDFKPFVYKSTQSLRENYSQNVMMKAEQEMQRINQLNQIDGNFKPTWESLDQHTAPEWYLDSKFGMFVDWGLYSIPAYAPTGYPDWYLWRMHADTKEYHNKYWGEDFREDDFIPLFTAKDFNADHLAKVANEAGMKYVVPFLKHHDGFCLWNTSYSFRNSVEMGPRRDIAREWVEALRKYDLKFGFYYSIDDWIYPIIGRDDNIAVRQWHPFDGSYYKVGPFDPNIWDRVQISGKIPVRDFYNDYINPSAVEFIDKYDPDLIWMDGDWIFGPDERNTRTLVAYYYNQASGRKEVAINDAYGCTRLIPTLLQGPNDQPHGDFNRSEAQYTAGNKVNYDKPWEECHGLSHSFGYKWEESDEDVRSAQELLYMLIDIVSEGGNLLLITNLTLTGELDPLLAERLKVVGSWLRANGEAIYATRKWTHSSENNVRFTRSKDGRFVYAICKEWPDDNFTSEVLNPRKGSAITMLGSDTPIPWKMVKGKLSAKIPGKLQDVTKSSSENAWVFKIEIAQ